MIEALYVEKQPEPLTSVDLLWCTKLSSACFTLNNTFNLQNNMRRTLTIPILQTEEMETLSGYVIYPRAYSK